MSQYLKYISSQVNGMQGLKTGLGTSDWDINFNSSNVGADIIYSEEDLTTTPSWTAEVGNTLTASSVGTGDPTRGYGPVGSETADYSILFGGNGTKYLRNTTSGYGAINGYDSIIFLAWQIGNGAICGSYTTSPSTGWYLADVSGSSLTRLYLAGSTGTNQYTVVPTAKWWAGSWTTAVLFLNFSDSKIHILTGGYQETTLSSISWGSGTITEDEGFAIGSRGGQWDSATDTFDDRVMGFGLWNSSGWLSGATEANCWDLGRELNARWAGTMLDSSNNNLFPAASYRNTESSSLRQNADGNTRIYYFGENLITSTRAPRKTGATGPEYYLNCQDSDITQLLADPDDPSGTNWTLTACSRGTPQVASPDQDVDAYFLNDTYNENAINHYASLGSTAISAGEWCFAVFVKEKGANSTRIEMVGGAGAGYADFDIEGAGAGTVTGTSAVTNYGIIPCSSSWYLVWVGGYQASGWTSTPRIWLQTGAYSGSGYDMYVLRAVLLERVVAPLRMPRTNSFTWQNDLLRWPLDQDDTAEGSLSVTYVEMLMQDPTYNRYIVSINDDGSALNELAMLVESDPSDAVEFSSEKSGGSSGSGYLVYDATDGDPQTLIGRWKTNDLVLEIGASSNQDTSVTPPVGLNRLYGDGAIQELSLFTGYSDAGALDVDAGAADGAAAAQSATIDAAVDVGAGTPYGDAASQDATILQGQQVASEEADGDASSQAASILSDAPVDADAADGDAAAQSATILQDRFVDGGLADGAIVGLSATILLGTPGTPEETNWSFEGPGDTEGEAKHWTGTFPATAEDLGDFEEED